jgi:hypothetical protein
MMATPFLAPVLRDRRLCLFFTAAPALLAVASVLGLELWHCPFHRLTGLDCPGCGMTRAGAAMLTGDFRQALAHHPLAPALALVAALMAAAAVMPAPWRERLAAAVGRVERQFPVVAVFLLAFLAFGVARLGMEVYFLWGR